jgi:heme-degrading monooxygenase HmoA
MTTLFVHHKVEDYAVWRKVFDDLTPIRTSYGAIGQQVFQSPDDPNEVAIFTEFKTIDQAESYAASDDLKEGMKNAGVASQPEVMFLVEV